MSFKHHLTSNPFTVAWLTWFAMFFFIEALAVWTGARRGTLSSHLRDWLSDRPTWVIVAAWAFMIGLAAHFLIDLKRGQ